MSLKFLFVLLLLATNASALVQYTRCSSDGDCVYDWWCDKGWCTTKGPTDGVEWCVYDWDCPPERECGPDQICHDHFFKPVSK